MPRMKSLATALLACSVACSSLVLGASTATAATSLGTANPSASSDGRYVVFESGDASLVPSDTNRVSDIFRRDTLTGAITRVSVSSAGRQANGLSTKPYISSGGRYVVYESAATNLVSGDTNRFRDVFRFDTQSGKTARVSVNGATAQGNAGSFRPQVSTDGNRVVFESDATNLVTSDRNGVRDVFARDLTGRTTTRVSQALDGRESSAASTNGSISYAGDVIAFQTADATLDPARPVPAGADKGVSVYATQFASRQLVRYPFFDDDAAVGNQVQVTVGPQITGDGARVVFAVYTLVEEFGETVEVTFVRVWDWSTDGSSSFKTSEVYGYIYHGVGTNVDGSRLAYLFSRNDGLPRLHLSTADGSVLKLLRGNVVMPPRSATIAPFPVSTTGRYVVFTSTGRLTTGDTDDLTDVYQWDTETGVVRLLS